MAAAVSGLHPNLTTPLNPAECRSLAAGTAHLSCSWARHSMVLRWTYGPRAASLQSCCCAARGSQAHVTWSSLIESLRCAHQLWPGALLLHLPCRHLLHLPCPQFMRCTGIPCSVVRPSLAFPPRLPGPLLHLVFPLPPITLSSTLSSPSHPSPFWVSGTGRANSGELAWTGTAASPHGVQASARPAPRADVPRGEI